MSDNTEETFTLPSSPTDRKKIKDALHEAVGCLQFIQDKKDDMKSIFEVLENDFKMPKSVAKKMATTMFKDNYNKVTNEASIFEICYETIIQS